MKRVIEAQPNTQTPEGIKPRGFSDQFSENPLISRELRNFLIVIGLGGVGVCAALGWLSNFGR